MSVRERGQVLPGGYRVIDVLRGGMGAVYICHHDDTGDWVVKSPVFDDSTQGSERRARFTEEVKNWIRVSKRTQCPKIVRAFDFMAEECLLVLEFVDGLSISQVARKDKPVRPVHPRHFLKWARDIAEAMREIHEKFGMVHRDLKPQNVLIATEDLDAKVTDLFIAKAISEEQHTATIIGTLNYMAPEVSRGGISFRSDIYSYGATLFWMLSCEHALALRGPLDRGWPPRIQQLIERCLQEDPAARPESFAQVLDLLDHAEQESEIPWSEDHYIYCAHHRFYSPVTPPGLDVDGNREVMRPVCLLCRHSLRRSALPAAVLGSCIADLTVGKQVAQQIRPHTFHNAQFTVYRPRAMQPDRWYKLLAFAHLAERPPGSPLSEPDPSAVVKERAAATLGREVGSYQDLRVDAKQPIPKEGEITFVPEAPGIEFHPRQRSFLWLDAVHQEEFQLRARAGLCSTTVRGRLSVFCGSVLLAEVDLQFRVEQRVDEKSSDPLHEAASVPRFRRVFASYSHKDREVVRQVERYAAALGDEFLRDVTHLRTGEAWSDRLRSLIRAADVFQLFWSWNSMESRFVKDEWTYALSLDRHGFVRPVYWQQPMPARPERDLPPEELRRLHFCFLSLPGRSRILGGAPAPAAREERVLRMGLSRAIGILAALAIALLVFIVWLLTRD
jgi:hypothetical protein